MRAGLLACARARDCANDVGWRAMCPHNTGAGQRNAESRTRHTAFATSSFARCTRAVTRREVASGLHRRRLGRNQAGLVTKITHPNIGRPEPHCRSRLCTGGCMRTGSGCAASGSLRLRACRSEQWCCANPREVSGLTRATRWTPLGFRTPKFAQRRVTRHNCSHLEETFGAYRACCWLLSRRHRRRSLYSNSAPRYSPWVKPQLARNRSAASSRPEQGYSRNRLQRVYVVSHASGYVMRVRAGITVQAAARLELRWPGTRVGATPNTDLHNQQAWPHSLRLLIACRLHVVPLTLRFMSHPHHAESP
jgi:hypothetical protein